MIPPGQRGETDPRIRSARLVLLALIVVLPLAPPEIHGTSMTGCALLLALLAVLAVPGRAGPLPAGALTAAAVVAWPLARAAEAPGAAVEPLAIALLAGGAALAAAALSEANRGDDVLPGALAVAAGVVSIHALVQRLWGLDAVAAGLGAGPPVPDHALVLERLREGRAFAGFATPAALGGFLAIALPVTVALALGRRGRGRRAWLALAAVQAAAALAAASATALVALALALALAVLARAALRRPRVALALGALGLAILAVVALRGPHLLSFTGPDSPWRLRAGNWRIAWEMYLDRPWLGAGPGGYGELYPAYRRPGDNEAMHAHDLPLELLAEGGLPGLLILGGLFYVAFLGPLWRRRRDARAWETGAAVGLAAFAIQNLADFTASFASLLWLAALLRGSLAATRSGERTAGAGLLRAASLVAIAVAAAIVSAGGLAGDARYAAREAWLAGRAEAVRSLTARAVRLAPWRADGWLLRLRAGLELSGAPPDREALVRALADAERAVRCSPVRPAARAARAGLREALGDLPGAFSDLAEAARLYPMQERYARERDAIARRLGPPERGTREDGGAPP